MARRTFSREFKLKAVNIVSARGVIVAQATGDLNVNDKVFRRWMKEPGRDSVHAFSGQGSMPG